MNRRQFIISLAITALQQGLAPVHVMAKSPPGRDNARFSGRIINGQQRYRIPADAIDNEKDACLIPPDIQAVIRRKVKKNASHTCLAPLMNRPVNVQASDYQTKMRLFNRPHPDDRYVAPGERALFTSCLKRFNRIYRTVGHTHFYLLGMDDAFKLARGYHHIGRFSGKEKQYLESVFHHDAVDYGFYGQRLITDFANRPDRSAVSKIPGTANYLFKGEPVALYNRLRRDIGHKVILTSGIRGVVKQFLLFFRKTHKSHGNLSMASRSIAPPGYTFHGVGDFDVGQVGYGGDNFSVRFIRSQVFEKLIALDYICLRYTEDNPYGVRFEPWHVMTPMNG